MLKRASGDKGVVTFGHAVAATLQSWTLLACEDATSTWNLTATAQSVNLFYSTRSPLTVSLRMGSRSWRWESVALEIVGKTVRGVVSGRPEVK